MYPMYLTMYPIVSYKQYQWNFDTTAKKLAYHVACDWGLWRGDPEALAQNTSPVGQSGAVPEQHSVTNRLHEAVCLCCLHNLKHILHLQLVRGMRLAMVQLCVLAD